MTRPLGRFELAQTLTDEIAPLNAVIVLRLEGAPSPEALRRALDAVQRRHPLLRVRLERDGKGWRFAELPGPPTIPLELRPRPDDDAWRTAAEEELNRRVDALEGPLLRVLYLGGEGNGGHADLVATFHHVVTDAASASHLLSEVLDLAADPGSEAGPPRPLPPPLESLFPPPFRGLRRLPKDLPFFARQMKDELVYRLRTRGERRPEVDPRARNRLMTLTLERDDVRALVRHTRRLKLSLHSALVAALLLATGKHLYGGRRRLLRHVFFADLRPFLTPPPDPADLASYFVLMRLTLDVDPEAGLWPLAARVNEEVAQALRRGDKFVTAHWSPTLVDTLRGGHDRMAATALAYTGPLTLRPEHGTTRVSELHAFVSNVAVGPEFTAQVRLDRGRLVWDVVTLDTDLDDDTARAVAEEVRDVLSSRDR